MNSKVGSVLLLADQPWQLRIMSEVVKLLRLSSRSLQVKILTTDYYTFLHQASLIKEIRAQGVDVGTLEELYRTWQIEEEPNFTHVERQELSTSFKDFDLEFLKKTNQWIYGDERNRFYLPMSEMWKEKIFRDTLFWCKSEIERFKPNKIYSIERSTLPNNIIFEIAKRTGIVHKTLIPARIDNYWYFRDDFGRGATEKFVLEIESLMPTKEEEEKINNWITQLISTKSGAYESLEFELTQSLLVDRFTSTRKFLKEILDNCKKVYARFYERSNFKFKIVRLEQSLVKLTFSQFRQTWLIFLYSVGIWNPFQNIEKEQTFFLWALHSRPEGSVLALNNGQDEIQQLFELADQLPDGVVLVVKENIEMLGLREPGFYRRISANPKIVLLDPETNLKDLCNLAVGVIGISGTFLLEAALYDKPVFALGRPEFISVLGNSISQNANDFVLRTIAGENLSTYQKARKYLAFIFQNGFDAKYKLFDNRLCDSNSKIVQELIREISTS